MFIALENKKHRAPIGAPPGVGIRFYKHVAPSEQDLRGKSNEYIAPPEQDLRGKSE